MNASGSRLGTAAGQSDSETVNVTPATGLSCHDLHDGPNQHAIMAAISPFPQAGARKKKENTDTHAQAQTKTSRNKAMAASVDALAAAGRGPGEKEGREGGREKQESNALRAVNRLWLEASVRQTFSERESRKASHGFTVCHICVIWSRWEAWHVTIFQQHSGNA